MRFVRQHASLLVSCLFLVICTWQIFNFNAWHSKVILNWDVGGYNLYLPATIIYDDLAHLRFFDSLEARYNPNAGVRRYAIFEHPETGRSYIKYTCGVALFQAPLFFAAHVLTKAEGSYDANGYTPFYQLSICLSSLLFEFLSLLTLRRFLRYYFSESIVATVLLILGFGTGIMVYSTSDPGLSHIYLFFLYAVTLLYTRYFFERATFARAAILGLAVGMAVMMRPTDIFLAFVPLLWGLDSIAALRSRGRYLGKSWKPVLCLLACATVPLLLQMGYWKYITNHWIWFSYSGEKFVWDRCMLWSGLMSYRKGWFVYTPLALLGFIGFISMLRKKEWRFYTAPFIVYYAASFYVLFCWENWWYGGSFGCRALLQSLALLALPTGYLLQHCFSKRNALAYVTAAILSAGIFLNCFQSLQYRRTVITDQSMNRAYYWRVFLKPEATEEDRKLYKEAMP